MSGCACEYVWIMWFISGGRAGMKQWHFSNCLWAHLVHLARGKWWRYEEPSTFHQVLTTWNSTWAKWQLAPLGENNAPGWRRINGWFSSRLSSTEFFKSLLLSFSPNLDEFNPDIPEWRQDVGRVIKKALLQVSDFHFLCPSRLFPFPSSCLLQPSFLSLYLLLTRSPCCSSIISCPPIACAAWHSGLIGAVRECPGATLRFIIRWVRRRLGSAEMASPARVLSFKKVSSEMTSELKAREHRYLHRCQRCVPVCILILECRRPRVLRGCVGSSAITVECHSSRRSLLMNSRLHLVAAVGRFWWKI